MERRAPWVWGNRIESMCRLTPILPDFFFFFTKVQYGERIVFLTKGAEMIGHPYAKNKNKPPNP